MLLAKEPVRSSEMEQVPWVSLDGSLSVVQQAPPLSPITIIRYHQLLFNSIMSHRRGYKLSMLERKKDIDYSLSRNGQEQAGSGRTEPIAYHEAGSENQFVVEAARLKVPYLLRSQPGLCFTVIRNKQRSVDSLKTLIMLCDPTVKVKYYHSLEEGSVQCVIFRFQSMSNSQQAYLILSQDKSLNLHWCDEMPEPQFQRISFPESPLLRKLIDGLSHQVIRWGLYFQRYLIKLNRPMFEFLNYVSGCQIRYYRWRVYSYLMGDSQKPYNQTPFQMQENGPYVYPPMDYPIPKLLSPAKRVMFSQLLSQITTNKDDITKLMVFAIKHSQNSAEVALIITESFCRNQTQLVARMFLVSDIMHNSLALNFPGIFKVLLPNFLYRASCQLKISQRTKTTLVKVLKIWQQLLVYDQQFFRGLYLTLRLDDQPVGLDQQLIPKSHQQIYDMCVRSGLPTQGKIHLHLSKLLGQKRERLSDRVEDIYDGMPLGQEQIAKILKQTIDVMTYHSISHLKVERPNTNDNYD